MASNNSTKPEEENQESKASEIIANNYDLATQILLLTPPASISNLKFTSKLWHSISIDPTFIRNHTRHHPPALSGLFVYYFFPTPRHFEYVAFKPSSNEGESIHNLTTFVAAKNNTQSFDIIQSCNGLLLCDGYEGDEYVCYVCNPTTLQRKRIPVPKKVSPSKDCGLNLAFDPRISSSYKIVCVKKVCGLRRAFRRHRRTPSKYQVEVYSSVTGDWKTVGEPFIQWDVPNLKRGVFCKGAIHWLTDTWACRYFDLNHEYMKSTTEYHDEVQQFAPEYFGQSHDQLCIIDKLDSSKYNFLQMREDYSTWFIKYVINLDVLCVEDPSFVFLCIGEAEGGNNVDECDVEVVIYLPFRKLVRINPRTNASAQVGHLVLPVQLGGARRQSVYGYFETICPV